MQTSNPRTPKPTIILTWTIPVSGSKLRYSMSPPSSCTAGRMRVSSSSLIIATIYEHCVYVCVHFCAQNPSRHPCLSLTHLIVILVDCSVRAGERLLVQHEGLPRGEVVHDGGEDAGLEDSPGDILVLLEGGRGGEVNGGEWGFQEGA
jgi:hypothetical protein